MLEENEPIFRYWIKGGKRETVFDFRELFKQGYFRGRMYSLEPDGTFLLRMFRSDADLSRWMSNFRELQKLVCSIPD